MEKLADTVEGLLEKELFLYQELEKILEQEKNDIVELNVDSLWKTIDKKKQVISNLEPLNKKMLGLFEKSAADLGMDKASFKLSDLIGKLPVSKQMKSRLKMTRVCLDTIKKSVSALASANKEYINESLTIMDGVFSTVAGTVNKKLYNNSGSLLTGNGNNCLINAEV